MVLGVSLSWYRDQASSPAHPLGGTGGPTPARPGHLGETQLRQLWQLSTPVLA